MSEKRLKDYGQNIIPNKKKKVWILRFLKQMAEQKIKQLLPLII